jgi:polygalacturonase
MPRVTLPVAAAAAVAWLLGSNALGARVCNVLDYGAVGDNVTEDTSAVAAAIAACAGSGGGTGDGGIALLPANRTYLLRPVQLPSHSVLQIDGDISAWPDLDTWPNSTLRQCATTPYETPLPEVVLVQQKEALLWSVNATNLTITGNGVVDGGGWRWWPKRFLPGDYWHNCRCAGQ